MKPRKTPRFSYIAVLTSSFCSLPAFGAFSILIDYTGPAQFEQEIRDAADIWESLVTGYQDGTVTARSAGSSFMTGQVVDTLFITADLSAIDGAGGTLGSAGPNEIAIDSAGFTLATDGQMTFDSADIMNLSLSEREALFLHEMAHVMGFGTLWNNNGVYVDGSGEYTGAGGTEFWQSEFGQMGTPDVELAGGPGTADGHWNEVDLGSANTGITDGQGRDLRFEVMTGWLNSGPQLFVSNMTLGSFEDIGFTTVVPEPSSSLLLAASGLLLLRRRR